MKAENSINTAVYCGINRKFNLKAFIHHFKKTDEQILYLP